MQYMKELPHISAITSGGDEVEFEIEEKVEVLPATDEPIIFVADYAGQAVVAVGKVLEHKAMKGPEVQTRLKIKGACVSFLVPVSK